MAASAHHDESSARGWSIRIPRRDVLLVVTALALGGGGGSAVLRLVGGGPAAAAVPQTESPTVAELAAAIAELKTEVAELKRVQGISSRNQLLICDLTATLAHQPNKCREP